MAVHFCYDENKPDGVLAWCGRTVRHATKRLTEVECISCRKAFAARLRQLPYAEPEVRRDVDVAIGVK